MVLFFTNIEAVRILKINIKSKKLKLGGREQFIKDLKKKRLRLPTKKEMLLNWKKFPNSLKTLNSTSFV